MRRGTLRTAGAMALATVAIAFYTEVMGGTEVMRDGDLQGDRIQNARAPDGEQLEFVQALGPVKKVFGDALEARRRMRTS